MKKIAIIDDSSFDQSLMTSHLVNKGFAVESFLTGEQFFSALDQQGFDIVVLDVIMPAMSGLEVLEKIREHHHQMILPVIMLSAIDSYDYIQESVSRKANEYMLKPLDFRLFDLRLETHLGIKELYEQNQALARQRHIRLIVEQYHHELLNPLTIATNALHDLDHAFKHDSINVLKQAHDRIEETIRKIYTAYKSDLE